jgi:hypothetical protein
MKTAAFLFNSISNNDSFVCSKEAAIWYFGESALDFNSGIPVTLTDGKLTQTKAVQLYLTKTEITFILMAHLFTTKP